jgi:dephospho-CoA kinase
MLRVGLTGDLGSGKSTVARMFAAHGAIILSSDEMGREMMQPGQPVFYAIVERFGREVVAADGSLDRRELARLAFNEGRAEELNAIVHPAVLGEQARQIEALAQTNPDAVVMVESALIFSTRHGLDGQPWSERFDKIVLVTAPEAQKIERFLARIAAGRRLDKEERVSLEADARRRLAMQISNDEHAAECTVLRNDDGIESLQQQVDVAWSQLQKFAGDRQASPNPLKLF